MVSAPGYWMHETSGVLVPAVRAYLDRQPMADAQIAAMRAYLRQWILAPAWCGPMVDVLRTSVDEIRNCADIRRWLHTALEEGIDPL